MKTSYWKFDVRSSEYGRFRRKRGVLTLKWVIVAAMQECTVTNLEVDQSADEVGDRLEKNDVKTHLSLSCQSMTLKS